MQKKYKLIKKLSFVILILEIISIIFLAISPVVVVTSQSVGGSSALLVLGIILLVIAFVFNILNAVNIFTFPNPKNNSELNNYKIIFGIFTIILLGWIASLIFVAISKQYIVEENITNQNNVLNNQEQINNETI
ncbi:hypothetical protein [Mycoplasmoides pirum]|uniref:hypothetical protein n=1 Tax=Mycoplasmoides pirum TaxID=2122 RepID=UPI000481AC12|nr:hypothetical protein [Mycoplasmoides pirum]